MATTHTLTANTFASAIPYAAGDTINLGGFRLSYDVDKSSTSVILAGAGILHMQAGGGILIGGAVPSTIFVETDDNLPIRGSLDYGCAAVIKTSGREYLRNIHSWSVPTEERSGRLWGRIVSYDSATRTLVLDVEIPSLEAGDYITVMSASIGVAGYSAPMLVSSVSGTHIVMSAALANANIGAAGGIVCVTTCPLMVYDAQTTQANSRNLSGFFFGGDVLFSGASATTWGTNSTAYVNSLFGGTSHVSLRRLCYLPGWASGVNVHQYSTISMDSTELHVKSVFSAGLRCTASSSSSSSSSVIGEFVGKTLFETEACGTGEWHIGSATTTMSSYMGINAGKSVVISHADVPSWSGALDNVEQVVGNATLTSGGTATLVSRSSFPTDTDMADAYYFAPATASDEAWRTDTYHVRRGETLRLSIRAMRAADGASLSVEVADDFRSNVATWTLDANAATLEWQSGHLEWMNTSDRDCEVTVRSSGTGNINGGYLRVWRSTGGAM